VNPVANFYFYNFDASKEIRKKRLIFPKGRNRSSLRASKVLELHRLPSINSG
jgi:hypothetical protein